MVESVRDENLFVNPVTRPASPPRNPTPPDLKAGDPRFDFDYPYTTFDDNDPHRYDPFVWVPPVPGNSRVDWWADVASTGGTRLCFHILTGLDAIISAAQGGVVAALLNWSSWDLCLIPWGQSNANFPNPGQDTNQEPTQDQAEAATRLGMIFGMVLTPTDTGGWTHFDAPVTLGGRTELWHTRLVAAKAEPTMRAVWSLGQAIDIIEQQNSEFWDDVEPVGPQPPIIALQKGDPLYVAEPKTALTIVQALNNIPKSQGPELDVTHRSRDPRFNIVATTSRMDPATGAAEMPAHDTSLTSVGGTLTTSCEYVPNPSLSDNPGGFRHAQVLGRDVADGSETAASLWPFGHKVWVETQGLRAVDQNGYAVIDRVFTLQILDPLAGFDAQDMKWPFSKVRLLTRAIPKLNSAFQDPTGAVPTLSYEATDMQGRPIRFDLTLGLLEKKKPIPEQLLFTVPLGQQTVAYAAGDPNNTTFETDNLQIALDPTSFAPTVVTAVIRHPALQHFGTHGAGDTITVKPSGGIDELGRFGAVTVDSAVAPESNTFNTARYGAFAAPNLEAQTLSKTLGAAGKSLEQLTDPLSALTGLLGDTTILGLFPLANLLASGAAQGPDLRNWLAANGPQIVNQKVGQLTTISVALAATPNQGQFSVTPPALGPLSATLQTSRVTFSSSITMGLADPQATATHAVCELSAPTISLAFNNVALLQIILTDLRFEAGTGVKPSFSTEFKGFQFENELAFLNGVMAVLPPNLFSNPPQLVITDTGATAECAVAVPSFGVGAFSFSNVGVDTSATIRFDMPGRPADPSQGGPLQFQFGFSSADKPFSIVVSLLTGQGYFHMDITSGGLTIDAALAFGGAFELNLGVIEGGVALTAGIHLRKNPDLEVGGFLHFSGGIEVLGLVGLTVDAMMSLSWQSGAFTGTVELSFTVHLGPFHKSVSATFTKTFAGGPQAPELPPVGLPPVQGAFAFSAIDGGGVVGAYRSAWVAYCGGFAA
jgi:hypothetical protein